MGVWQVRFISGLRFVEALDLKLPGNAEEGTIEGSTKEYFAFLDTWWTIIMFFAHKHRRTLHTPKPWHRFERRRRAEKKRAE